MDIFAYLEGMASQHGPSGHEASVAQWLSERFRPLCDSVTIDALYNVIAVKKATLPTPDGSPAPRVMLCAHQDEIALMVSDILPDGTLRMDSVGGVAYTREELFVDLCMAPEKVKKLVNIGDLITLQGPAVKLLNHRAAAKTMDDRSCVGCLLLAAERLQKMQHMCDIYFVASSQEEVGGRGAAVASYTVDPDLAVVLDVTFAPTPQCPPDTTCPLDAPATAYGPYVQHRLLERLKQTAKENGVTLNCEHTERSTGTDADDVQIARAGVPCVLLSLPVKYMHTSVELLDMNTLSECGRLLALFVAGIDEKWEDGLWN